MSQTQIRIKYYFILFFFISFFCPVKGQISEPNGDFNQIVIKLSASAASGNYQTQGQENKVLQISDIPSLVDTKHLKPLPFGKRKSQQYTTTSNEKSVLDNIYLLDLGSEENIEEVLKKLKQFRNVEYAEPVYQYPLLYSPNDSNIGSQVALSVVKAFEAWDVTQGNESIVVAISDTGAQLDHPDLLGNLYTNDADPVNGLDDDGNGYIDDYQGWDFADNDNDVTDIVGHGTHVAGISSATTDNATGIAGVGFNCKFVPLKIFRETGSQSFNAYTSIIYAADQGYDVINLSWGSFHEYSQFEQDIIDYAVLEKDLVIVAAAGNTNEELVFYPASYDHVLSVANTDMEDSKSPGATFSYCVDVTAPGFGVYSTKKGSTYASESGSSFSSPHAAGAAALVRSEFPEFNALQVIEQVRVTADDIYDVGENSDYTGRLGKGRLNVFKAVSDDTTPSVRMKEFSFSNAFGEYAFHNDTVTAELNFTNYLRSTQNLQVALSSENSSVIITNPTIELGAMGELDITDPFEVELMIGDAAELDERVIIRMDISDVGYEDFDYFEFNLQNQDLRFTNDMLSLNVSNNGTLGIVSGSDKTIPQLSFLQNSIAEHISLLIGNHPDSISDNASSTFSFISRDGDFVSTDRIRYEYGTIADRYAVSTFNDSGVESTALGLEVEQKTMAWTDTENDEFLIIEYRISNSTNKPKDNLKIALFADWQLGEETENKANWDVDSQLAYAHNGEETLYSGLSVLSGENVHVHSIDLGNENGNTAEITDDFSEQSKYDFMHAEKLVAGVEGNGNNIAQLLATEIGSLGSYESKKVAFVLTVSESLTTLKSNVENANEKYTEFLATPPLMGSYTFCVNSPFVLHLADGSRFELFDDPYMTTSLAVGNDFEFAGLSKDSILYVRNLDEAIAGDVFRVKIEIESPNSDFLIEPDTLYLGDQTINQVQFHDLSENTITRSWDFGNGSFGTAQNPKVIFNEVGIYQVDLTLTTDLGCTGTISRPLVVAERSEEPAVENQTVCKGTEATLTASNSNHLRVYVSNTDESPIYTGNSFTSDALDSDTVFYISSTEQTFESHRIPVEVGVLDIQADFSLIADTLDVASKNQIVFSDQSINPTSFAWFVDGNAIGNASTATYVFSDETNLEVRLDVTNEMGCSQTITKTIDISSSSLPTILNQTICRFEQAVLSPENGSAFYFYDNAALTTPIYKGRSFSSSQLAESTTFYITGVDKYRESAAVEVTVSLYPFETQITADPELLILNQETTATFTFSSDETVTDQKWFLNDEFVESVASPILSFNQPKEYKLQLVATNSMGCIDTTTLNYQVINVPITGIDDALNPIRVYPNPSSGMLSIESDTAFEDIQLFDAVGNLVFIDKTILERRTANLNLSHLPNGIYFLYSMSSEGLFKSKIILTNP